METMDDIPIIDTLWHWRVEDGLDWDFCAGIIKMDYGIETTGEEVEKRFQDAFKELTGYIVYTKCPKCDGEIVPRSSQYGLFVSCSEFPNCDFKGTDITRRKKSKKKNI